MTLKDSRLERYLHEFFELGLFMKAFNGTWETIVGVLFLVSHGTILNRLLVFLARGELFENSQDKFIGFLTKLVQMQVQARVFATTYILIHGALNIFLAIQLYRNKLWAYQVTTVSMVIFISYQFYRIYLHHSGFLTVLTVFDVIFVFLTLHEYKHKVSVD